MAVTKNNLYQHQTESNLKKHIGIKNNITAIYNGVDISKFINPVIPIKDSGNMKITMVAGFRVGKDQYTLIRYGIITRQIQ